jgi:uncharacterized membrane protein YbaN (DUF454 family)
MKTSSHVWATPFVLLWLHCLFEPKASYTMWLTYGSGTLRCLHNHAETLGRTKKKKTYQKKKKVVTDHQDSRAIAMYGDH